MPAFLTLTCLTLFWLYAGWQQNSTPIKADLRQAVAYTIEQRSPNDLLVLQIPHMHYSYRYYSTSQHDDRFTDSTRRLAPWMPGIFTNDYATEAEAWQAVDHTMQTNTIGYEGAWTIYSETELWDNRRVLNQWLEQNGILEKKADFRIAEVRYYRFR